jgi:hypothetical protein
VEESIDRLEQAIRAKHEYVKYIFIEAKSLAARKRTEGEGPARASG